MILIKYDFDESANELVADVVFENNGDSRRTITSMLFTYHGTPEPENHERKLLVDNPSKIWGVNNLSYIEPKKSSVETYRQKANPELLKQIGNVFGLQVYILNMNGETSFTNIDIMTIQSLEPYRMKGLGRYCKRIHKLSLDKETASY